MPSTSPTTGNGAYIRPEVVFFFDFLLAMRRRVLRLGRPMYCRRGRSSGGYVRGFFTARFVPAGSAGHFVGGEGSQEVGPDFAQAPLFDPGSAADLSHGGAPRT